MTVRDRSGRHRYIGFTVEARWRVGREELQRALSEAGRVVRGGPVQFNLTIFDGRRGIVKVPHTSKQAAIEAINSIRGLGRDRAPAAFRTVVTSGTICTVKARMGIPPGPRPWERKRAEGKRAAGSGQRGVGSRQ
jgi:RNase P/RNase MRP subunit POP5